MNEVEVRSAQLANVDYPKRLVELIVMPYETETQVWHHGRMIGEIVSRGAYQGIEARNGRVRVNRDHDVARLVGRALALHPSRHEGLVAEIRISKTPLGDETLVLADDGILDASAGFSLMAEEDGKGGWRVKPGAEVWETRDRRRLNHLYLDHVSMTPSPAYPTAAVLSVRAEQAASAMPNRERLELLRWQELESNLDKQYSVR